MKKINKRSSVCSTLLLLNTRSVGSHIYKYITRHEFQQGLRSTTLHRYIGGSGLIGVSVGGKYRAWAEPPSVDAASEIYQRGWKHSFFSPLSHLNPTPTLYLHIFVLCHSLHWKQSYIWRWAPSEAALTLRSGRGQRRAEMSVVAFTVSTLGETWWLSAAISEFGGGGVKMPDVAGHDMHPTAVLLSGQASCFTHDKSITSHVHI